MHAIVDSSIVSVVLIYLLLETDALYEYLKLFRITKILKIEKPYLEFKVKFEYFNFLKYLLIHKNNFITRLVNCPICLSIWINVIFYLITGFSFYVFYSIYITWVLYFFIKILVKHLDENE